MGKEEGESQARRRKEVAQGRGMRLGEKEEGPGWARRTKEIGHEEGREFGKEEEINVLFAITAYL